MSKTTVFCEFLVCFHIHDTAVGTVVTSWDKILDLFMVLMGCNVQVSKQLVEVSRSYRADDFVSLYSSNVLVIITIGVLI